MKYLKILIFASLAYCFVISGFGGLFQSMNPYNPDAFHANQKIEFMNRGKILYTVNQENFFSPFTPGSIKGSFKYFYYRWPELSNQVAKKFCSYMKNYKDIDAEIIRVSDKDLTRDFDCIN